MGPLKQCRPGNSAWRRWRPGGAGHRPIPATEADRRAAVMDRDLKVSAIRPIL
jgi:hypothetical protein